MGERSANHQRALWRLPLLATSICAGGAICCGGKSSHLCNVGDRWVVEVCERHVRREHAARHFGVIACGAPCHTTEGESNARVRTRRARAGAFRRGGALAAKLRKIPRSNEGVRSKQSQAARCAGRVRARTCAQHVVDAQDVARREQCVGVHHGHADVGLRQPVARAQGGEVPPSCGRVGRLAGALDRGVECVQRVRHEKEGVAKLTRATVGAST
eukprot:7378541-Prymnesium_polylepis.3